MSAELQIIHSRAVQRDRLNPFSSDSQVHFGDGGWGPTLAPAGLKVCVCVCSFVCVFVWLCVDSCLSLFPWLVGCLCLYVLVCFLALFSTISCFTNTFGDRVVLFLHFGGPWGSIVTPGAPFCHPWWKMQRVFCAWRDLEAQFVDPWAPCGLPWNPFWCLFTALGPDPGLLL